MWAKIFTSAQETTFFTEEANCSRAMTFDSYFTMPGGKRQHASILFNWFKASQTGLTGPVSIVKPAFQEPVL